MDTIHQLWARFQLAAIAANPLVNDQDSLTLQDIVKFGTNRREERLAREKFNALTGRADIFRDLIIELRKRDEAVADATKDPRNTAPGIESQSSSPCLGI